MTPEEVRLCEGLLRLLDAADERDRCAVHPANLLERMTAQDERSTAGFVLMDAGWEWQRDFVDWMHTYQRTIALKARQLGATWLGCGYVAWTALYRPGSLCLIFRQKEEEAWENVGRVWTLMRSLPAHLWNGAMVELPSGGHSARSEIRLRFPNGKTSRILAMTSASASGHGKTAAVVLLDEFSRIDRAGEIMKAVQPAAGSTGKIVVISTANGQSNQETGEGNRFHWEWQNAEDNGFQKRFLPWSLHPDRDQSWYDHDPEVRGLKSYERAEQYPANEFEAFALSDRNFFDPADLLHYAEHVAQPLYRLDFELMDAQHAKRWKHNRGMTRVYAEPHDDRKYAIGADVATGRGLDYSAAYVVDLSAMSIAAEFHGRLDADLYAAQLHYLARWYNTAIIAVETAGGYGEAVIIPLRDGRAGRPPYPNLYRHVLSGRPDLPISKPYGFPTNTKTRPLIINQLDKALRPDDNGERALPYVTANLLAEMQTFVYRDHGPSPAAQEGSRDDCVMAAAITLEMYRLRGEHPERKKSRPPEPEPSRPWHGLERKLRSRGRGSRDAVVWDAT